MVADNLPAGMFGPLVRGEFRKGLGEHTTMRVADERAGADTLGAIAQTVGRGDPLWGLSRDDAGVAQVVDWARENEPAFGWYAADGVAVEALARRCETADLVDEARVEEVGYALGMGDRLNDLFAAANMDMRPDPEEAADEAMSEFVQDADAPGYGLGTGIAEWDSMPATAFAKLAEAFAALIDEHGDFIDSAKRIELLTDELDMPAHLVARTFAAELFGQNEWSGLVVWAVNAAIDDDLKARAPADGWEMASDDLIADIVSVVATARCAFGRSTWGDGNGRICAETIGGTLLSEVGSELYHAHFAGLLEAPVYPASAGEPAPTQITESNTPTRQEPEAMPDGSATIDTTAESPVTTTTKVEPATPPALEPQAADFMAGVKPGAVPAIVLERKDLVEALTPVAKVVPSKSTMPIVESVLIEANGGTVRLTGDDLTVRITKTIAGQVDKPGAVALPCHALVQMVRAMPEGAQVQIATDKGGERMRIRSGRTSFALPMRDAAVFPPVKMDEALSSFTLTAAQADSILLRPRHAINKAASGLPAGISLRDTANHIVGESGSSMGLHRAQAASAAAYERLPAAGVVVPDVTVNLLAAMLDGGDIVVSASPRLVMFKGGFGELQSKLVDQQFPDVGAHIEAITGEGSESLGSFTAERRPLIDSLNRVMLARALDEKTSAVTVTAADGFIELRCGRDANDASAGSDALEVCLDGELSRFVVNGPYLVSALEAMPGDTVIISHVQAPPRFTTQSGVALTLLDITSPTTDAHRVMVALMIG